MDRVSLEQMANLKPIEFETVIYYLRKSTNSRKEDNISVEEYNKAMLNRFDNAGFVYFKQEIKVLKR
jgi:hypothetical protein